jgi:PKD domain
VDAPPIASFTVPPPPRRAWEPIWFDGSASHDPDGRIVTFAWDCLGDGSLVYSAPGTNCVFPREGIYNVSLTVTDNVGQKGVFTEPVNVSAPLTTPIPQIAMSPPYGFVGEPVTFDGSGSADPYGWIVRWSWDFGDGNQSEGQVVSHTFADAGTYDVWLTAYNDRGSAAAVVQRVPVFALPQFQVYSHAAGFRLPVPIGWAREENVTIGGSLTQLVVDGPVTNNRATQILIGTDLDPSVRETSAYLSDGANQVLALVQRDHPDAFLDGPPHVRTISNHAAVTFTIRIPSILLDYQVTLIVREADHRYWLMLLTSDDSIFPLTSRVFETMSAGFEITLPVPPSPESRFFSSLFYVTLILGSVLGSVLGLRAIMLRRTSESVRLCARCGTPEAPGIRFCPKCGAAVGAANVESQEPPRSA